MTISIWIIVILLLLTGFRFYYKKNKHKVYKPEITDKDTKSKRSFTDIDKMLSHVTVNKKEENSLNDIKKNAVDDSKAKTINSEIDDADNEIDIKEKFIGSIILDRKKKDYQ